MLRFSITLTISALGLLLTRALLSQDVTAFKSDTTLVTIPCAVTNANGMAITGLKAGDFQLYVDGVRRKIDNFWSDADLPLLLGVVNDVRDSQRNHTSDKDRAIAELLAQVVHGRDRAFVVAVKENVVLKSDVSAGPYGLRYRVLAARGGEPLGVPCGTLEGAHGRKRPFCGGTALWNAIYASAHLKLSGPAANKALLILSDGNDTGSTHHFGAALDEVQRSGAVAYVVRYPDILNPDASYNELRRLADDTGGMLFDLHGVDYAAITSRIVADLRGRYVLAFRPDSAANETGHHSLKVEVLRTGATVRARAEYSGP